MSEKGEMSTTNTTAMTIEKAIEILEQHNRWRRGYEVPKADPVELGIAIDTALAEIRGLDKEIADLKKKRKSK